MGREVRNSDRGLTSHEEKTKGRLVKSVLDWLVGSLRRFVKAMKKLLG